MLSKYDTTKQKRIWYYTDDVSKFDNNINNKEHQIEGLGDIDEDWLREVRINNKGDIVPSMLSYDESYKNDYHWNYSDSKIHTTFAGGNNDGNAGYGLLTIKASKNDDYFAYNAGFVKVTILDD